jgi:nucleotide-binding universal stress UspA family protein
MRDESPSVQKILVAANASPHSQAALATAVQLAAAVEAEVEGVFVEDEQLLRAAELPFAAEVRAHSHPPMPLTNRRVERQLRRQAEQAEAALQRTAQQWDVPHSFRVVKGHVTHELRSAAADADLLALGKTSTDSSRRRLGSTARSLFSECGPSLLVLRSAPPPTQPILTYFDGSAAGMRTLALAAQLARRHDAGRLRVLLPARTDDAFEHLRDTVRAQYGDMDSPVEVHALTPSETDQLAALAHHTSGGLVVLPHGCAPLSSVPLQRFLYELDRPLLLVRGA